MPNDEQRPVYSIGSVIDFSAGGNAPLFERRGWSLEEPWGTWVVGETAALKIRLADIPGKDLCLNLQARPFVAPGRKESRAEVFVNGEMLAVLRMTCGDICRYKVKIPVGKIQGRECEIVFHILNPESPVSLRFNEDDRLLGLAVASLSLEFA